MPRSRSLKQRLRKEPLYGPQGTGLAPMDMPVARKGLIQTMAKQAIMAAAGGAVGGAAGAAAAGPSGAALGEAIGQQAGAKAATRPPVAQSKLPQMVEGAPAPSGAEGAPREPLPKRVRRSVWRSHWGR